MSCHIGRPRKGPSATQWESQNRRPKPITTCMCTHYTYSVHTPYAHTCTSTAPHAPRLPQTVHIQHSIVLSQSPILPIPRRSPYPQIRARIRSPIPIPPSTQPTLQIHPLAPPLPPSRSHPVSAPSTTPRKQGVSRLGELLCGGRSPTQHTHVARHALPCTEVQPVCSRCAASGCLKETRPAAGPRSSASEHVV
ncbi:hypothetical protein P154DRAFT_314335 [Amniculicola lignicola CBS 123094]|uniref:Uncharacterized protein n=1 Tax=Amniculicola lignicola CBS 123094 TaxID=1392246 RepID=A0A6A5WUU5_9PLEO|nr:hypothetical protein P154DRAFT_314335 [Amniculicola lignicola CBS 123094]